MITPKYQHNEQARTGPHLVSLNAQAYLCIIFKSQSHYPLNTKSAMLVVLIVEVVVGKTKSINYKLKF
jgi:hypothetical protein